MTDREIADQLQYCSPHTILVVTWKGKLKVLHTPFRVKVLKKVGNLATEQFVVVSAIKISTLGNTVFIINQIPYYYFYFEIYLN